MTPNIESLCEAGSLVEQRGLGHALEIPGCATGCELAGFALKAEIRCASCGTVFRFRRQPGSGPEEAWHLEDLSDRRPGETCEVKRIRRDLAAGRRAIRFQEHWRHLKGTSASS